jgi:acyl carrier protein
MTDDRIRRLFADMLQVSIEDVTESTRPETLSQWDSMQHLILVSGFEEEFAVSVEPEEAVEMYKDFATFRRVVESKLEGN